ncbi:MAG: hypothetical protein AAF333_13180 [Planctomycetota bacterium]
MPATHKTIHLHGDKRKPESAEHSIKFPGGSISLCRTSDDEYWAHIEVNHGDAGEDIGGPRERKRGEVVHSRVDLDFATDEDGESLPYLLNLPDHGRIQHIAVRIATAAPDASSD